MSAARAGAPGRSDAATTGGRLVVDALLAHGLDTLFCVPGESYLGVLDAMVDVSERLRLVTCRHESGAALMAAAQAQLLNRPAACFVTRGPGATNASIALHVARQASIPLVLGVGQVVRADLGREAFQEVDYEAFFAPLVKRVEQVASATAIPAAMSRAFHVAASGRPGPVVLAFPEDVLEEGAAVAAEPPRAVVRRTPEPQALDHLQAALGAAQRPLVVAGGGTWTDEASAALVSFAEREDVPVCVSFRRQDAFDNEHGCYAGYLGLNAHEALWSALDEADCVLVLGARLDEPSTRGYRALREGGPRKLVHVYPGERELGRNYAPDPGICADAGATVLALLARDAAGAAHPAERAAWRTRLNAAYRDASPTVPAAGALDPARVMAAVNERLAEDAIITADAGNFTVWPQRARRYRRPGRFLAPVNGAMGYGVPAAIGAALACPDRRVVGCVGDGGMLMTGMEIATAAKYGAKPIILVFNNDKFGTIEMHQERRYPGRPIGNALTNPDFGALARSFGLFGARVATDEAFDEAFEAALAAETAAVLDLVLSPASGT